MSNKLSKVVTIGGGTGSYVVLMGLKNFKLDISAIVTMMDSGGSTGKLRDQLGVLPPGDLRQALVALSESPEIWRRLFAYRFNNGDLKGHNFGNIFLSALEMITGSNQEAVDRASEILQIQGNVVPVTFTKCDLCARYSDKSIICGESNIEDFYNPNLKIEEVYSSPNALINLEAKRAIESADFIVFCPGDIYTSIFPTLIVQGMFEILQHSQAKKIYISNLMTRRGQTDGFKVSNFAQELEKYIGEGSLDYILLNDKKPSKNVLKKYKDIDQAVWVKDDLGGSYNNASIMRADLVSDFVHKKGSSDVLHRSLIRHDSLKISQELFKIFSSA